MEGRITIDLEIAEGEQPGGTGRLADEPRVVACEGARLGASGGGVGRPAKWTNWMDCALVRQVLATDPINCGRGRTVAKWAEVAKMLERLEQQPIVQSQESCRQRA